MPVLYCNITSLGPAVCGQSVLIYCRPRLRTPKQDCEDIRKPPNKTAAVYRNDPSQVGYCSCPEQAESCSKLCIHGGKVHRLTMEIAIHAVRQRTSRSMDHSTNDRFLRKIELARKVFGTLESHGRGLTAEEVSQQRTNETDF